MGAKIFAILMVVVALGVVVFIFRSGAIGEIFSFSFADRFSFNYPSFVRETRPRSALPKRTITTPKSATTTESTVDSRKIPEGFALKDLSPYFDKIKISSAAAGSANSYGRIVLSASLGGGEKINITGWRLEANRGSQIISQAINIYDPTGLTAESDIFFEKGNRLMLYTSHSAIGKNLRLNKCLGYLENTNDFTPSLPRSCPSPSQDENISSFTGACQNYVRSLGSCRLPGPNPSIPQNDYACRAYIDTINYRGCFDRHRGDSDFLSSEWWVWTGNRFLDSRHDRVLLFDRNGLLVDIREY